MSQHLSELLSHLCSPPLTCHILKILTHVPLKLDSTSSKMNLSLLHTATHCLVHTLLILIQDRSSGGEKCFFTEEERNAYMVHIVDILIC